MKRIAIVALAALAAGACSNVTVTQDYIPGTDFQPLRSWSWMPNQGTTVNARNNAMVSQRLTTAVENELDSRGYQQVDSAQADFHVGYHLVLDDEVDYQTVNSYWGGGWNYGMYGPMYGPTMGMTTSTTRPIHYTVGTLVIDFFSADEKELLWRGIAEGNVNPQADPVDRQRQVDSAVQMILGQFPPG